MKFCDENCDNCQLPDNQQLTKIINEELKKVVCEHLSLKEHCEPYSGMYAQLCWDDTELGSICINSFDDD